MSHLRLDYDGTLSLGYWFEDDSDTNEATDVRALVQRSGEDDCVIEIPGLATITFDPRELFAIPVADLILTDKARRVLEGASDA